MPAEDTLKEVLRPLIAKVRKTTIANREVIELTQGGKTIKLPIASSGVSSDTNTFE